MWPGCIYAAVRDVRVSKSALPLEPVFPGAHSGGTLTDAARQRGSCQGSKQRLSPPGRHRAREQFVEFARGCSLSFT